MPVSGRILVAIADGDVRDRLTRCLEEARHEVTAAAGLDDGLGLLGGADPSLVITEDGAAREALARLRQAAGGIPVLLLVPPGTAPEAVEAAADAVLPAAIGPAFVLSGVRLLLGRRDSRSREGGLPPGKAGVVHDPDETFRILFRNAPHLINSVDASGILVDTNDRMEAVLGYRREEVVGEPITRFFHPDDICRIPEVLAALAGGQPIVAGEYRMVRKDGKVIEVSVSSSALRNREGRFLRTICIIEDISERKRAEAALRLTQFSMDRASDAIFWVDGERRFHYVNDAACARLGYSREELLRLGVEDIDPGADREFWTSHWATLRRERTATLETRHRTRDGRWIPVEVNANFVEYEGREFNIAFARDISERKRAETALGESEERYRALFEESPLSIWVEDFSAVKAELDRLRAEGVEDFQAWLPDHPEDLARLAGLVRIVEVNGTSVRHLKARSKEDLVRDLPAYFSEPESWKAFGEELAALAAGATRFQAEIPIRFPGGARGRLDLYLAVAPGYEESLSRVLVSWVDVSDRRRAEENLRRSREGLRELAGRLHHIREDEQGRIAREIHDELGQLLTGLKLDLRWIERKLGDEEVPLRRNAILERAVAASELADLTLAAVQRIAADLRPPVLDQLGLEPALHQEAHRFQERTGIACSVGLAGSPPGLPKEAATAFFRIAQEALTNVARHSGAKRVEIGLEARSGWAELRVLDDGGGISPAEIQDPRSLGLLGMQERAKRLGGEVTFDAGPARGTVVIARIPIPGQG